jgi:hypothetical protein
MSAASTRTLASLPNPVLIPYRVSPLAMAASTVARLAPQPRQGGPVGGDRYTGIARRGHEIGLG